MTDLLSLIPEERPRQFLMASPEEQAARGRWFLMTYALGGSTEYSWFVAMGEELSNMLPILATIVDEDIEQALRDREHPDRPVLEWTPTP